MFSICLVERVRLELELRAGQRVINYQRRECGGGGLCAGVGLRVRELPGRGGAHTCCTLSFLLNSLKKLQRI